MGYEQALSTKKLATHCILCGQPLRDPISVETGVGPICRAKNGYNEAGNPETRVQCSKLIHAAAQPGLTATEVYDYADQIEALGFPDVAAKIRERFHRAYEYEQRGTLPIKMKRENYRQWTDAIWMHIPYDAETTKKFNQALKDRIWSSYRTGTKDDTGTFWWIVDPKRADAVDALLREFYTGRMCHSSFGDFIIGEELGGGDTEKAPQEEAPPVPGPPAATPGASTPSFGGSGGKGGSGGEWTPIPGPSGSKTSTPDDPITPSRSPREVAAERGRARAEELLKSLGL